MNEFLKLLKQINSEAFRAVKTMEYAIRGFIYDYKIERLKAKFKPEERNDVNCNAIPLLNFEDYPTPACLNRYLRENFGDRYPRYIEAKQPDYMLILKLVAITKDEGIDKNGMVSFNNGRGKIYNYEEYVLETEF